MASPRKPLRVVPPDETKRKRKLSLSEAVSEGSSRDVLVARRDAVVAKMSDCHPRDLASLDRRLEAILKDIESLDVKAEEEADDGSSADDEPWDETAI